MNLSHPVVIFDGVCNFCNSSVNLMIRNDPAARLRFVANQSESGQQLLQTYHLATDTVESVVLIEGGIAYMHSTAALRIARQLRNPWPLLYALILVPRPLRDVVYRWIARNRYRWFGKKEACRIPTPAERERFLI